MAMLKAILALALAAGANAECPNACSGHGDCTNYDACFCYRNWEGADCSLRTCPFGLAHVDSPQGDLDSSADSLSGPGNTVLIGSTKFPYGVQEQFPNMTDSRGNPLQDTAHYYMECSNKGICDRKGGECECFDGYEGSACQRAACPNDCSGHGTCEHVSTLAANDFDNIYDLWDAELTMGCACDPGYSGADCSSKDCKYGIDPLYVDDDSTARVEGVTYKFQTSGNDPSVISGTYALKFYDAFGEDYQTIPLKVDANCYTVEDALDGLPNTVIPDDSIVCTEVTETGTSDSATGYSLTFRGNPGYLKQLFVDTYLDGDRSTVTSSTPDLSTYVYNEGMTGEFTDYFATQCQNVYAEISSDSAPSNTDFPELNSGNYLELDTVETKLLKQCLGDSDGFEDDNVEVYDWDYGSIKQTINKDWLMMSSYPHAIKLVQKDPYDDYQGGMYYLTWWESYNKKFVLANIPTPNMIGTDLEFAVYVTDGVVERVIVDTELARGETEDTFSSLGSVDEEEISYGDNKRIAGIGELGGSGDGSGAQTNIDERVTAYFSMASNILYTSYYTACETAYFAVEPCLDKGDMLFIIDSYYMSGKYDPGDPEGVALTTTGLKLVDQDSSDPPTAKFESGNLYTIKKIYKEDPTLSTWNREDRYRIVLDKNIPFAGTATTKFEATNATDGWRSNRGIVNLFKFSPATTGNYDFVAPCSNRGICDEGSCECFKGYTDDNCDIQSSLAV